MIQGCRFCAISMHFLTKTYSTVCAPCIGWELISAHCDHLFSTQPYYFIPKKLTYIEARVFSVAIAKIKPISYSMWIRTVSKIYAPFSFFGK